MIFVKLFCERQCSHFNFWNFVFDDIGHQLISFFSQGFYRRFQVTIHSFRIRKNEETFLASGFKLLESVNIVFNVWIAFCGCFRDKKIDNIFFSIRTFRYVYFCELVLFSAILNRFYFLSHCQFYIDFFIKK